MMPTWPHLAHETRQTTGLNFPGQSATSSSTLDLSPPIQLIDFPTNLASSDPFSPWTGHRPILSLAFVCVTVPCTTALQALVCVCETVFKSALLSCRPRTEHQASVWEPVLLSMPRAPLWSLMLTSSGLTPLIIFAGKVTLFPARGHCVTPTLCSHADVTVASCWGAPQTGGRCVFLQPHKSPEGPWGDKRVNASQG